MAARARGIAASLGSRNVIQLDVTDSSLQRAASGRNWDGPVYVATPQLLRAYGITGAQASPDADFLTMRPGLPGLTRMQLQYGAYKSGPASPGSPCPPGSCLANPEIRGVSALPSGTSAPNTVVTEHAVHQLHLTVTTAGWLIQTPDALSAGQISATQRAAAAAGLTVETRNSIPTSAEILGTATAFGILLALGILAMSVGLLRSETASSLRTLTGRRDQHGPPGHLRRDRGRARADRGGRGHGGRVHRGLRLLPDQPAGHTVVADQHPGSQPAPHPRRHAARGRDRWLAAGRPRAEFDRPPPP